MHSPVLAVEVYYYTVNSNDNHEWHLYILDLAPGRSTNCAVFRLLLISPKIDVTENRTKFYRSEKNVPTELQSTQFCEEGSSQDISWRRRGETGFSIHIPLKINEMKRGKILQWKQHSSEKRHKKEWEWILVCRIYLFVPFSLKHQKKQNSLICF